MFRPNGQTRHTENDEHVVQRLVYGDKLISGSTVIAPDMYVEDANTGERIEDFDFLSTKIGFVRYVNTDAYSLADKTKVIPMKFGASEDTLAVFIANVDISVTGEVDQETLADGDTMTTYNRTRLQVIYELNDATIESYTPYESYVDGTHVLALYRGLYVKGDTANRLNVYIRPTVGSARIEVLGIDALVFGRAIVSDTSSWEDETALTASFPVSLVYEQGASLEVGISDSMSGSAQEESTYGFTDVFAPLLDSDVTSLLAPFSESLSFGGDTEVMDKSVASKCVYDSTAVYLASDGFMTTSPSAVRGWWMGDDITVNGVTTIATSCTDDILFSVSKDKGATWLYWNGSAWATSDDPSVGMTHGAMGAITQAQWADAYDGGFMMRFWLPAKTSVMRSITVTYKRNV